MTALPAGLLVVALVVMFAAGLFTGWATPHFGNRAPSTANRDPSSERNQVHLSGMPLPAYRYDMGPLDEQQLDGGAS